MKKLITTLLLVSVILLVHAQESAVRLELSSSARKIFIGDKVIISVRIVDPGLIDTFSFDNYKLCRHGLPGEINQPAFSYDFEIEATDTGAIRIEPIEIEYQNRTLKSNELSIEVVARRGPEYALFDVPPVVKCFSEYDIQIRSNSTDLIDVDMDDTKYYMVVGRSFSTKTNIENNESKTEYIRTFRIKFVAQGIVELRQEDLKNLPTFFKIDPVTIKIE